jgi:hypothetical protein
MLSQAGALSDCPGRTAILVPRSMAAQAMTLIFRTLHLYRQKRERRIFFERESALHWLAEGLA